MLILLIRFEPIVLVYKVWQFCPAPLWAVPPRFTTCRFSPPRKGGGAGMWWDFRPAPQGGAGMGLHFLSPPRPALIRVKQIYHQLILFYLTWLFTFFFLSSKVGNKVPILTFSFVFIINKFIYYWITDFIHDSYVFLNLLFIMNIIFFFFNAV